MPADVDLQKEIRRTRPDFVVYQPKSTDGSTFDTGNEHFLVFDGPDGSLMAVWTQSNCEGSPNQRIVFSRSEDEGQTWAEPRILAGPTPPEEENIASWGFPLVSESGRIYVLWSQHIGVVDSFYHTTGLMHGRYSDDFGKTWSEPRNIPMPRSRFDNDDPAIPANWIVWQKPERLSDGKYFVGFTRWTSNTKAPTSPEEAGWTGQESHVEFMRFENADDHPETEHLQISCFARDDEALRVPFPGHEEISLVQEPSLVALPDHRLFVTLRTMQGCTYWSLSEDAGRTWAAPRPLCRQDDGDRLLHPLSPCPIYRYDETRYVFLHHNHDGHIDGYGPYDTSYHRRPLCLALGEYRPGAEQPVWFSESKLLMDHGNVPLGPGHRRDLAMYSSFTIRNDRRVLWYPDRKFFLLGRVISEEFLAGLRVPE
jgi:hypothetical protein